MYRGRFAPSPTGPLHFGSLVAAAASYLDARSHAGQWLIRIEDVDETRAVPGAGDAILRTLEAFGFEWDGPVLVQSLRKSRYREVSAWLVEQGLAYPCCCTRADISRVGLPGIDGYRYPGTCRNGLPPGVAGRSIRLKVDNSIARFEDRVCGEMRQNLADTSGDFVIRRADGLTAYQLAVVVDDHEQGITHVVRGADLLSSTAKQLRLFQLLGGTAPTFAHVPLVVDDLGRKLSKSTQAKGLSERRPVDQLAAALATLGQIDCASTRPERLSEFWPWALAHWDIAKVGRAKVVAGTL